MAMEVFKLIGTIAVNSSDANKAIDDTTDKAGKSASKIDGFSKGLGKTSEVLGKVGKSTMQYVSGPLAVVATGVGKAAMDLEASEAKYNTVFEGMTAYSDAYIKEFQKLTPATTAEARGMASGIQDLLIPMGFARDEATNMTGEFMHVAGALTNFNSGTHTAQDVMGAMSSAILGEYDSLKSLGIQLDASTVKEKALEQGLIEKGEEVDKQTAAQVVMNEIYAQSGDALAAYTEENVDSKTESAILRAEVIDLAAELGQNLLPIISSVVDFLRNVTESFSGLSEGTQKTILTVGGLLIALGPVIMILSKLVGAVQILIPVITAIGSIGFLPLIAIIGAVVAAGVALWMNWDKVKTMGIAAWQALKDMIPTSVEELKASFNSLIDFVKNLIPNAFQYMKNTIYDKVLELQEMLPAQFSALIDSIGGYLFDLLNIAETVLGFIFGSFKNWFDLIVGLVSGDMDKVKGAITNQLNLVKDTCLGLLTGIKDLFSSFFSAIKEGAGLAFSGMYNTVVEKLSAIKNFFTNIFSAIGTSMSNSYNEWLARLKSNFAAFLSIVTSSLTGIKNFFVNIWQSIWNFVTSAFDGMKNVVKSGSSFIYNTIVDAFKRAKDTVMSLITSIQDGISSMIGGLGSMISGGLSSIPGLFKDALLGAVTAITNLFSVFRTSGKSLVGMVAEGILSGVDLAVQAIDFLVAKLRDFLPFSPAKTGPLSDLDKLNFGGTIATSIENDESKTKKAMNNMMSGVRAAADGMSLRGSGSLATSMAGQTGGQQQPATINIENMTVREEQDIRKIAQELNRLQKRDSKGG